MPESGVRSVGPTNTEERFHSTPPGGRRRLPHLRCGINAELHLGLLAVVVSQALHQQGREPGTGSAAEAVEDEEALQSRAVVGHASDPVQGQIHDFPPDGVMAAGVVVGGIFFAWKVWRCIITVLHTILCTHAWGQLYEKVFGGGRFARVGLPSRCVCLW